MKEAVLKHDIEQEIYHNIRLFPIVGTVGKSMQTVAFGARLGLKSL